MSAEYEWAATVERQAREIDRLRAELAELKSWMDDNDDSFVAELHEARAETGRLRADHATAYANTVALAKACVRLRAVLAAVIAICDAQYRPFKADPQWVRDVRAAIGRNEP